MPLLTLISIGLHRQQAGRYIVPLETFVPNANSGHSTHFLGCELHLLRNERTHTNASGFQREN